MRTLRRVERGTRPLLLLLRRAFLDGERARPSRRVPDAAGFRRRLRTRFGAARRLDRRLLSSVGARSRDARTRFRFPFRASALVFKRLRRPRLAFDRGAALSLFRPNPRNRTRRASGVRAAFRSVDELAVKRSAELPFAERRSLFPLDASFRSRRGRLLDFIERSAEKRRRTPSDSPRLDGSQLDFRRTSFRRRPRFFSSVRRDERAVRPFVFLTSPRVRFFRPSPF